MNIWYFGLAPQKERYTAQLSERWMPNAAKYMLRGNKNVKFLDIRASMDGISNTIQKGHVLDAKARCLYSMRQCHLFLEALDQEKVNDGDVVFLQDYWTPGIEGVLYALHVYGLRVRLFAMCHAQSVDEYDFTYPMDYWMRNSEHALDRYMAEHQGGIFVASTIHKTLLREAGFNAQIHVVGLPLDYYDIAPKKVTPPNEREPIVVYASRMHKEKNPKRMLVTADDVLRCEGDAKWIITTSADHLQTSNDQYGKEVLINVEKLKDKYPGRFIVKTGLSKREYYDVLSRAKVIFNSAYQDFVSWTLLEGLSFGCIPAYPKRRSFPECLPSDYLYEPNDWSCNEERNMVLDRLREGGRVPIETALRCNAGRLMELSLLINAVNGNYCPESDVWQIPMYLIDGLNHANQFTKRS